MLLELKANNTKPNQRRKLRKQAYAQLQTTLADIDQHIPESYERRAITCFRFSNDFPTSKTTNQDQILFFEETFRTSLEEGNTFTFK